MKKISIPKKKIIKEHENLLNLLKEANKKIITPKLKKKIKKEIISQQKELKEYKYK